MTVYYEVSGDDSGTDLTVLGMNVLLPSMLSQILVQTIKFKDWYPKMQKDLHYHHWINDTDIINTTLTGVPYTVKQWSGVVRIGINWIPNSISMLQTFTIYKHCWTQNRGMKLKERMKFDLYFWGEFCIVIKMKFYYKIYISLLMNSHMDDLSLFIW